jgi:hypothetical protein
MQLRLMSKDTIKHYRLRKKAIDGYVYMEIRKGMYSFPQASILANKLLKLRLACHGYFKQPHMTAFGNTSHDSSGSIWAWTALAYQIRW